LSARGKTARARRRPGRRGAYAAALAFAALVLAAPGCATYSERFASARSAVDAGNPDTAIEELSAAVGVRSRDELPDGSDSNTALGLLERGSLLQAVRSHAASARDWTAADKDLEVLDLTTNPVKTLGSYLYSDSAKIYRLYPTEQLALNTLNMLNFLSQGDLGGARVEARRFTVAQEFLRTTSPGRADAPLGSYLAGFVFEHLGEANDALRYYDEALGSRNLPSLRPSLVRLARRSGYRGRNLGQELARAGSVSLPERAGDLLVVMALGRVPHRVPERMAVGAAVGIAGVYVTGDLDILERSALKVLVYPALAAETSRARGARVRADGVNAAVESVADFASTIRVEHEDLKPKILGAALTRLITRAAAAEGVRAGVKEASSSGIAGLLAALLVEGAMVGLDQPDTRSWNFLPARVLLARLRLPPGPHQVEVEIEGLPGVVHRVPVNLEPDGFAVVTVAELR
jgi:hypothetical protein